MVKKFKPDEKGKMERAKMEADLRKGEANVIAMIVLVFIGLLVGMPLVRHNPPTTEEKTLETEYSTDKQQLDKKEMSEKKEKICYVCENKMELSKTTVILNHGEDKVIENNVEVFICPTCGEEIFSPEAVEMLQKKLELLKN